MKLPKGSVLSVPAGSLILVERGTLWLTQNPDRTDYLLAAGEAMRLARKGSPVVSALRDSTLRVVTVERGRTRWRGLWPSLALRALGADVSKA
jgi:hypothetical protein